MSKSSAHDTRDIHHHLVVTASPEAVFAAIDDVRGWWWGDLEGDTDRLGAEFTYRYQDLHTSRQRVIEHVPGRRIVWRVESAHLSFVRNPAEWTGTLITFELTRAAPRPSWPLRTAASRRAVSATPRAQKRGAR
jgi:hypothetical protein